MSLNPSKRRRSTVQREYGSSSSSLPPPSNINKLPSRGGKQGKASKKILDGYYYNAQELEGTIFWDLVKTQKWDRFLSSSDVIIPDWVYFFYEHVHISLGPSRKTLKLSMSFGDDIGFKYTNKDLFEDFGVECRGFNDYADVTWPESLPSFVEVSVGLNNGKQFAPEEKKDHTLPWQQLFTEDDRFATYGFYKAIVPSGSQDRRVNRVVTALLYTFKERNKINLPVIIGLHMLYAMNNTKATTLPYGMLVTHIMRKWACCASSSPLHSSKIHLIGLSSLRNQGLVLFRGRLLWGWQIEEASPEDRLEIDSLMGRAPQAVNDDETGGDGEGDDLPRRTSAAETSDMGRNEVPRGDIDVREELRRLSERQDGIMRTQAAHGAELKKQGKFLKGIMKFLRCLGKGEGSSEAAQRYLDHSDSEEESASHDVPAGSPIRAPDDELPHQGDDSGMGYYDDSHH